MKKSIFQRIKNFKFRGFDYYAMRGVSNKTLRDALINFMVSSRGKKYKGELKSTFINFNNLEKHVENMNKDGFTVVDFKLSPEKLNGILSYVEKLQCYDPYRKNLGPIDPDNAPEETHTAHYKRAELVGNPDILSIANDNGILALAQEFLGATPTISNINLWWSFGGRKQAEEAQLYHRDVDDWKFCKFFIYLTDVSPDNGPHIYVRGTSSSPKLRKIRRYMDNEIEDTFGKENVMKFVEPKGSAFMVDTYGFHKGLLPKSGKRLLLQVQYSLNPLKVENYTPVSLDKAEMTHDKFVNRLIVES
ncbi:phytanoyl-CoA dioxygenase family protein [Emticicia agri]|uniref:Phytanoyl-CoA dioxygenase n=1 Tax=Emticicia agri TaxID=2492393 RepID=A0A4Q5LTV1_9BACT|nr:phytanoyl-CoA dioxygenase family protein [Emticicia agri]RYU92899.1 hypothetical protein EWM59_24760 [Emticicia agri]